MLILRLLPLLLLFGAAPAKMQASDLAQVAPVIASASDFKALLIAMLALQVLLVVPLISLLGYLTVRFLNASTTTASAMSAQAATLARMESVQASSLARLDDTLREGLLDLERKLDR